MVIFDTNIIIDHLRQTDKETLLINFVKNNPNEDFCICLITVQELYEGQSSKIKERANTLLATLAKLKILPYTFEVAKKAGEIARDENKNIKIADAAIAATCLVNGAQLLTINYKDFIGIKDLDILKFKSS